MFKVALAIIALIAIIGLGILGYNYYKNSTEVKERAARVTKNAQETKSQAVKSDFWANLKYFLSPFPQTGGVNMPQISEEQSESFSENLVRQEELDPDLPQNIFVSMKNFVINIWDKAVGNK